MPDRRQAERRDEENRPEILPCSNKNHAGNKPEVQGSGWRPPKELGLKSRYFYVMYCYGCKGVNARAKSKTRIETIKKWNAEEKETAP